MTTPRMLLPKTSCKIKGFHFQDIDKWRGEWSKPRHKCNL